MHLRSSQEVDYSGLGQASNPYNVAPTMDLCNMRGKLLPGLGGILLSIKANAIGTMNLVNRSLAGMELLRRGLVADVAGWALGIEDSEIEGYVKADGTTSNRVLIDHAKRTTGRDFIVCSKLAHKSIEQAAGKGIRKVEIEVDSGYQMNQQSLLAVLNEDVAALILTAGTTELGVIERLSPEVEARCRELGIWIHVDAAHGGMNLGCLPECYPEHHLIRELVKSPAVKSVTVCPHKFVGPYGCSLAILKKMGDQGEENESLYIEGATVLSGTTASSEIAYKAYTTMKHFGKEGLEEMAKSTFESAQYFSRILGFRYGIHTIVPVRSGIVPIELKSKEEASFLCRELRKLRFNIADPIEISASEKNVQGVRFVFTPDVQYDDMFLVDLAKIVAHIVNTMRKSA